MRIRTFWLVALGVVVLAGCGSSTPFANRPRPATPVNLTVYINNARVSVSPSSVGAGPVIFIVTNQAKNSESLTIKSAGASEAVASTGPINPQATAEVTVDFQTGDYTITTGRSGSLAEQATANPIQPATLHIGPPRPSASNQLLQP
jgi:hypothetical protein